MGLLTDIARGFLDLIFPRECAGCGRIDRPFLCSECRSLLEWIDTGQVCARCGMPVEESEISIMTSCPRCRESRPKFDGVTAALEYAEPLSNCIVLWKYEGMREISETLSELLCERLDYQRPKWWPEIEAVIPVPHHESSVKLRGFSPPDEIASPIAERFGLPFLPKTLFKIKYTCPQNGLDLPARMVNLVGSMKVFDESITEGKTILVIDDVMTTGSTLNECARALKHAGVKKVYGLVIARHI